MRPDRVSLSVADVTPKTRWIFVEVETEQGCKGVGEASLIGREQAVADALARFSPPVFALPVFALPDADPNQLERRRLDVRASASRYSRH